MPIWPPDTAGSTATGSSDFGLGADVVTQAAVFADLGIGGNPVTSWNDAFGAVTSWVGAGSPTPNTNGSVRTVANGATSNSVVSKTGILLPTNRVMFLFDVDFNLTGNAAAYFTSCHLASSHGFRLTPTEFVSQPSFATTILTHAFSQERFRFAILIDRTVPRIWCVKIGAETGSREWTQTVATLDDWTAQSVQLCLGNNTATAGRLGTHDWHGAMLLSGIPAFGSNAEAYAFMRGQLEALAEWASPVARKLPEPGTSTAGNATHQAVGDVNYTVIRTSSDILLELVGNGTTAIPGNITANRTFTLHAGQVGDVVRALRHAGGSFTWSRVGGDGSDMLRAPDDLVVYQCTTAPNTWARQLSPHGDFRRVVRLTQAALTLDSSWDGIDIVVNANNTVFTLPENLSVRFFTRLIQEDPGFTASVIRGGAADWLAGSPTETVDVGDELWVEVIQNVSGTTAVYKTALIKALPAVGGGGASELAWSQIASTTHTTPASGNWYEYTNSSVPPPGISVTVTLGSTITTNGELLLRKASTAGRVLVTVAGGFTMNGDTQSFELTSRASVKRKSTNQDFEVSFEPGLSALTFGSMLDVPSGSQVRATSNITAVSPTSLRTLLVRNVSVSPITATPASGFFIRSSDGVTQTSPIPITIPPGHTVSFEGQGTNIFADGL